MYKKMGFKQNVKNTHKSI